MRLRALRALLLRIGLPIALPIALAMSLLSIVPTTLASPSSSAQLLVAQGREREIAGDPLTALKRYGDAIALDPTCEDGFLSLTALRERRGELGEAEQVATEGLTRLPGSIPLVVARAHVRRLFPGGGKLDLAADDLRHALAAAGGTAAERTVLRELVALKRAQGEPAAELAAWRRLLAIGRAEGDDALSKEASLQARALGRYVGEVDPALGGRSDVDAVRRAIAAIARRQ